MQAGSGSEIVRNKSKGSRTGEIELGHYEVRGRAVDGATGTEYRVPLKCLSGRFHIIQKDSWNDWSALVTTRELGIETMRRMYFADEVIFRMLSFLFRVDNVQLLSWDPRTITKHCPPGRSVFGSMEHVIFPLLLYEELQRMVCGDDIMRNLDCGEMCTALAEPFSGAFWDKSVRVN